ncbi:PTS glucose transporter subunit IIABC [Aerococcus urinaehominis]|uniref:PTS glucose transporter subunit IIABC n=2 Tax=Aerococcus urinaehominis TaxID=128944 RepID=A0A0X8FMX1_9LACT|nr:PTS glucose transporter subunit IIABC [Aerococcus urinaehominis]
MLPISLLPVAGLFLGIGSSFTNPTNIDMFNLSGILYPGSILYGLLSILAEAGNVIFAHLGLFFGISIAAGLAKAEKGVSTLSAIIGYFVIYAAMTATLHNFRDMEALGQVQGLLSNYLGFENTMNLGVIGGIAIGCIVVYLHNRYYTIELPEALSFFGGTHFIPIAASVAGVLMGILMAFIWPLISWGFSSLGAIIAGMGVFGIFLYAYIYRALIPFGLHHVFYLPFWQTAIGGTAVVAGKTVVGAQNIVFAQLAAGEPISPHAAAHFSYMFPVMLFGIPAACAALYQVAYPDRKEEVRGFYTSAGLTSFATGITEPIEFAFVFASPAMYYGIHCVMYGIAAILCYVLGAGVAVAFSGGVIDFVLYGLLPGNAISGWLPVALIGLAYIFIYYFMFRWAAVKFDWKTPGREDNLAAGPVSFDDKQYDQLDERQQRAYRIVSGLGGTDNLQDFTNCATRLRVTVKDGNQVNEGMLKTTGSSAVVKNGNNIQVVYGSTVPNVKTSVDQLISDGYAPSHGESSDQLSAESDDKLDKDLEPSHADSQEKGLLLDFKSPGYGEIIALDQVDDPVFGTGIMGQGFALRPNQAEITSPIAGKIMMVMDSKHAIGLETEQGLEVLIHMGIDTVALDGQGFEVLVAAGDQVEAGQALAKMDLAYINDQGKATDVIVVVTNSADKVLTEETFSKTEASPQDKAAEFKTKI